MSHHHHHGGGGAAHLASIYGSEQDKVNCSFYLKIGACRHGDRCSRKHIKPQYSQTLVIQNMYQNPQHVPGTSSNPHLRPAGAPQGPDPNFRSGMSEKELQEYFDQFYEDVYCELVKFGNLLELHVCDNIGDHLIGNVYARYDWEDEAALAVETLNSRWYAGRPLFAELSPVTDFREACCRQNDLGECNRGGYCNFMHLRHPSRSLLKELQAQQRVDRRLFPSARDEERKKEMEMFGFDANGDPPAPAAPVKESRDRDYDRRSDRHHESRSDRGDRDRDRDYDRRRRDYSPKR